ncbi:MAG: flagellar export chaperone FliS [Desulforhopalus sp.]
MTSGYSMNQYLHNQVKTASPEQVLLILYDGAIRYTRQAIAGILANKSAEKGAAISRAMAIIAEFSDTLDHEVGGQIAEELDALYSFMLRELIQANLRNDVEKLKVVETLLVELRQTWGEAVAITRRQEASVASAVVQPRRQSVRK